MNNIKVIILKNGLELVSEVSELQFNGERGLMLHRPMKSLLVPMPMPTPQGMQLSFTGQMMPLISVVRVKDVPLDPNDVWVMMDAPKDIEAAYLQLTSGIKIAPASSIITG